MPSVAVRLSDHVVAAIDALIESGVCSSRADVIRRALGILLDGYTGAYLDDVLTRGYRNCPQSAEESAIAHAATVALIEAEPW